MPFKAVQAAKCPKCGKSVYANEERLAGLRECSQRKVSKILLKPKLDQVDRNGMRVVLLAQSAIRSG